MARNLYFSAKFAIVALALLLHFMTFAVAQQDPLPSWNRGVAKQNIISFVTMATQRQWGSLYPAREPHSRVRQ